MALEALKVLRSLEALKTLKALRALKAQKALSGLRALRALEALEALEVLEALEKFFIKPICSILSFSYCVSWPLLLMLCFLIFLMFEVVMPYALWSCLYNDTLLDLLCLMLRCLTFPAS